MQIRQLKNQIAELSSENERLKKTSKRKSELDDFPESDDEELFNLKKSKLNRNTDNTFNPENYLHSRLYYLNKKPQKKSDVVLTASDAFEEREKIGLYKNSDGSLSYVYRGLRNGIFMYSLVNGKFLNLSQVSFFLNF